MYLNSIIFTVVLRNNKYRYGTSIQNFEQCNQ